MFVPGLFALCFTFLQAGGTPQLPYQVWPLPPPSLDTRFAPLQNSHFPPPFFALWPHLPTMQSSPFNAVLHKKVPFTDGESVEEELTREWFTECDPKVWQQKETCYNSTTIRTCTKAGTFSYTQCHGGTSCDSPTASCLPYERTLRTFTCPAIAGFYPDPQTCRIYHICQTSSTDTNTMTGTTVRCTWPQIYDPTTQSCQMKSREKPCYRFKCIGLTRTAYPGDANIYADCSRFNRVGTMTRCETNYGWNDRTQQCETPYCKQEGNIAAETGNANQYYSCFRTFKGFIKSDLRTCPGTFDSTTGLCSFSK